LQELKNKIKRGKEAVERSKRKAVVAKGKVASLKKEAVMKPILITGAAGINANTINGVYLPTEVIHNNHTLFRKEDDTGRWLAFATSNKWLVQATKHKDKNNTNGFFAAEISGCTDPVDVSSWKVYMGEKKWEVQASVKLIHTVV